MSTTVIVALDVDTMDQARRLVDSIGPAVDYYKVGKQLFTRCGPTVIDMLKDCGKNIFLDLKFHDIPNTVAKAVTAGVDMGVNMINVHASGGREMLKAAAEAAHTANPESVLLAVTVLTSLDAESLRELGLDATPAEQVVRLAKLAQSAGVDGVVASAKESCIIRENCGPEFVQVLPGIRPAGADVQDQKRVVTPGDAASMGAQYIVIGRPITQAPDPAASAVAINEEIRRVLGES